jgi:hypothetical protein
MRPSVRLPRLSNWLRRGWEPRAGYRPAQLTRHDPQFILDAHNAVVDLGNLAGEDIELIFHARHAAVERHEVDDAHEDSHQGDEGG